MNDNDDTWRRRRGIPVHLDDDHTPVFDLLDRELNVDEAEDVRRSRRSGDDPATVSDLVKVIRKVRRDQQSSSDQQSAELRELLSRLPREASDAIKARLAELERDVSSAKRILKWVGGAALSAVLSVVGLIYSRGLSEGAYAIRIDHLERAVEEVRTRMYDRHSEIAVPQPAFATTTKD